MSEDRLWLGVLFCDVCSECIFVFGGDVFISKCCVEIIKLCWDY